jgi:hypothetical protein
MPLLPGILAISVMFSPLGQNNGRRYFSLSIKLENSEHGNLLSR